MRLTEEQQNRFLDLLEDVALLLAERAERHGFDIIDIPVPDTDSLGRGIVVYWPQVEWPEGRVEQEEEEDEWA